MKKRGSIVVANLEALTYVKELKIAVIDAGKNSPTSRQTIKVRLMHNEHDQLDTIRVTNYYIRRKNVWCENRSESDAS